MWECHSQPSWNEWNDREFGTLRVVLFFGSQGSETGSPTHGFDEKWGDFPLRKLVQKPLRKFFQQGPSPIILWCVPISWRWMNYTGSLVGNHQMSQGIQGGRWWDGMGVNSTWKIWFLMFSGWWFQTCGFKHVVSNMWFQTRGFFHNIWDNPSHFCCGSSEHEVFHPMTKFRQRWRPHSTFYPEKGTYRRRAWCLGISISATHDRPYHLTIHSCPFKVAVWIDDFD